MHAFVSIDRTSLGLAPLVIGGTGAGTYTITDAGLGRVAVAARATTVSSPFLHGDVPVAVVRDTSSFPLQVLVSADSQAALQAAGDVLDVALWQFAYEVTVTVGEASTTWACSPASYGVDDGATPYGRAAAFCEVWTITVPVYPIPVS